MDKVTGYTKYSKTAIRRRILHCCQWNQMANISNNEVCLHDGENLYRVPQQIDKHDFMLCLKKLAKRGIYPEITVKFE